MGRLRHREGEVLVLMGLDSELSLPVQPHARPHVCSPTPTPGLGVLWALGCCYALLAANLVGSFWVQDCAFVVPSWHPLFWEFPSPFSHGPGKLPPPAPRSPQPVGGQKQRPGVLPRKLPRGVRDTWRARCRAGVIGIILQQASLSLGPQGPQIRG